MFELTQSWWELVARVGVVYFSLLVLVRLSGKRTVGQFTPFDLLVVLLLSESVSAALSGGDDSLSAGLILAVTLIAINLLVAVVTARSKRLETLIEGRPLLIGRDGEIFIEALRKQHVSTAAVEQALREADCEVANMHCAFLEADGKISILRTTR
jgi:uncharacterized membrane protein YcaP (DUF421 family)